MDQNETPTVTESNMEEESETETCSERSLEMLVEEQSRGVAFMDNDVEKYSDSGSESSGEPAESMSETTDNKTDIDADESSAILDVKGSRDSHPKIVQNFRSEPKSEAELSAKSKSGSDLPVMNTYISFDGQEKTMVSLVTQTDWDWVEEALIKQENEKGMTSSDDDSCSDDDIPKNTSDEPPLLPSIGPPQILQYIRESELEEPETSDDYDVADFALDEDGRPIGIFGGKCEFCELDIKPFPTIEQQQELPPEQLYCCDQYREFVQFATSTAFELEEEMQKTKKLIDIKPHGHFGSKKARKAAKERAVQRMRDREMEKRKQEATGMNSYFAGASPSGEFGSATEVGGGRAGAGRNQGFKGNGPAPLSYKDMVARQMKTINYQLSSQKCLEEGWTKRAPTPQEDDGDMIDVFIPEPLDFTLANSAKIRERELIQKNYENGKKFLMIFPDGTGSVFYPSGYLAVSICKMDAGQFIYVVHDNSSDSRIMGVFEPNGHGCCYHNNGNVRLYFDQLDGIELDKYGAKKKKWSWKDQETHVHAPPFQPICVGLNRSIGLRVMSQEHITVTFMAKNRSCRFNVGARLRLMKPENIKPKEVSDNMIFMEEKAVQIENVLHKVSNLLRFPHSPKIDKILPPLRVTHRMQKVELLRSQQKAKRQSFFPSRSSLNQTSSSSNNTSLPAVVVN
ncbi:hypothetical protein LOTGIDRAFT_229951 [Lottia gigantea]|uniref:FAM194 C-terminal domain-containing protein n=1 Tax=Lottia gigantea TaxID=225164 RepID=V4BBD1_LOTGI|nr:hypothetical protein LOTGIDRAFT_229951 [Lottia gigantea]ESP04841.1 hypothetical protein LOTGIDRAFT_229951 [Lottia gigantea]